MIKKIISFLFFILIIADAAFAIENVFTHPSTAKNIAQYVPVLKDASCKFTQERNLPAYNTIIKSGGNFKFIKDKGVIFDTEYPIKSTVSYTSGQNKHVNDIILAISNKNYSYLDKNFNMYFVQENGLWTIGLKPKNNSLGQMQSLIISGKTDINHIKIDTLNNGITDIRFNCGK